MKFIIIALFAALAGNAYGDCRFNNKEYKEEAKLMWGGCQELICKGGVFILYRNSPEDCDMCYGRDDVHVSTFDHTTYDNDIRCQSLMTEILLDPSYATLQLQKPHWYDNIKSGVATDFVDCFPDIGPSCVKTSTFKNLNTMLTLQHKPSLQATWQNIGGTVNSIVGITSTIIVGIPPSQVFVWKSTYGSQQCISASGKYFTVQACERAILIFVNIQFHKVLGGLCGHYNEDPTDDFIASDGDNEGSANANFKDSWLTFDQPPRDECKGKKCLRHEEFEKECRRIADKGMNFMTGKFSQLKRNFVQECTSDLCAAGDTYLDKMKELEKEVLEIADGTAPKNGLLSP